MPANTFTPPPADEPTPTPTEGASDTGAIVLPAVITADLAAELDELAGLFDDRTSRVRAEAADPPTGKVLVAYMRTQLGRPPGKVRENVNDYTQWYYGNNTAASWCLIFINYSLNHFGALGLLGGKIAYVPSLKARVKSKWHTDRMKISCGDPVTFDFNKSGEPEHVGTFVEWQDGAKTRFTSIEGNTGDDVVALRTRFWYDVYGYVKPGLSASQPTPTPTPGGGVTVPTGTPVLKLGSTGTRVRELQIALNSLSARLSVDGDYGTKTERAVSAFQTAHHLTADGEYGPKTAAVLEVAVVK